MKPSYFSRMTARDRGLALIIVISSLALISVLVVAIFALTRREFKSTQGYVAGKSAKQLGDVSVAIVQAQIQNGQALTTKSTFHATQPGMVRVYNADGSFKAAQKLYSSGIMSVTSGDESALYGASHVAPTDWNTLKARYVDINEPVVRPAPAAKAGGKSPGYSVYFPVIDPRATYNFNGGQGLSTPGSSVVEGFNYTESTPAIGNSSPVSYADQTVTPTEASSSQALRLPMPVEWLYVLQDGTVGALSTANVFVTPTGAQAPSATNPIVGRIAFWTDDESCKININTAGEPTFSSTPYFFHQRDSKWAHFPAATGEYQRFPGHPATVALSSVFLPNYMLDPYYPSRDGGNLSRTNIVAIKNKIYDTLPKISSGGSNAGTNPFVTDDFSKKTLRDSEVEGDAATTIDLEAALQERLYASVDEMLFNDSGFSQNGRRPARFQMPGSDRFLFDHDTIERSRFFLTAHSRSPEFTIHGLPRVCIWPVADESLASGSFNERRTSFDNMIALTATIKPASGSSPAGTYFFRRAKNDSSSYDLEGNVTLSRNKSLLNYLTAQMSGITWPATSPSSNTTLANFEDKYGQMNVNQLAVQFFDYVRSTNLYDGMLARKNNAFGKPTNGTSGYNARDDLRAQKYTFTNQRTSEPPKTINQVNAELDVNTGANGAKSSRAGSTDVLPGHGQVSPIIWDKDGNKFKGFGRMFTISELGFQFICTADGNPDQDALNTFPAAQLHGKGGGTARRDSEDSQVLNGSVQDYPGLQAYPGLNVNAGPARWYSNFPPIEVGNESAMFATYGVNFTDPEMHPAKHPGFHPANWNSSLDENTPMMPNQKRVQAMLMLETFCPSLGWTSLHPEFTIVLPASISQITVSTSAGKMRLFDIGGGSSFVIKSNGNLYAGGDNRGGPLGGHATPTDMAGGRSTLGTGTWLPNDNGYVTNNTKGHNALANFQLISKPFTVEGTQMQMDFPNENIQIQIFDTHDWENATPIQTILVNLGQLNLETTLPVPHLVGSTNPLPDGRTIQGGPSPTGFGTVNDEPYAGQYYNTTDSNGIRTHRRPLPGPHWWGFNRGGMLHRATGQPNPDYSPTNGKPFWAVNGEPKAPQPNDADNNSRLGQSLRGRLDTASDGLAWSIPVEDRWYSVGLIPDSTSDVIRTIVPAVGDYRVLAAMQTVPASFWQPHPLWKNGWKSIRQAHSFSGHWANIEPGAIFASTPSNEAAALTGPGSPPFGDKWDKTNQIVGGAGYQFNRIGAPVDAMSGHHADLPPIKDWALAANAFGDFDSGIGNAREGAYINKPDEGNFYGSWKTRDNETHFERSSYFRNSWENAEDWRSGIFMTPNRLISSPVFFGSLPTGVWGNPGGLPSASDKASNLNSDFAPWQTLLFRPHAQITSVQPPSNDAHPGAQNPSDHYLLDLFYMPVVEPYAISEPLSIAGRINMNYQIMPFTHIRRATGMHAVMKGEFVTAIPLNQINKAKEYRNRTSGNSWDDTFNNDQDDNAFWHRPIDVLATLRQFDLRFNHKAGGAENSNGLFRSASQICDLHLIPVDVNAGGIADANAIALRSATSQGDFDNEMNEFWAKNRPTGDNVRERPYSNLYARLTTRSNTFRVHVRTQVIKKARSVAADTFNPQKDAIVSEYRGSTLIERYIDPNDGKNMNMQDYADSSGPYGSKPPLDAYYRFRVIESKRFAP